MNNLKLTLYQRLAVIPKIEEITLHLKYIKRSVILPMVNNMIDSCDIYTLAKIINSGNIKEYIIDYYNSNQKEVQPAIDYIHMLNIDEISKNNILSMLPKLFLSNSLLTFEIILNKCEKDGKNDTNI